MQTVLECKNSKCKHSKRNQHKSREISPSKLGAKIIQQQDVLNLIIEKLDIEQLLLCSLVCKEFLKAIDSTKHSSFNKYLRFWSLSDSSFTQHEQKIVFNRKTLEYEQKFALSPRLQQLWIRNIVPREGEIVQMRMPLNLSLEFDELSVNSFIVTGEEKHMQNIKKKGNVTIDAMEWKIRSITIKDDRICNMRGNHGIVVMNVVQFLQTNKHISIQMRRSISVTFTNVPVLHKMLPQRVLCVLKCMRFCMHCKQRCIRFESIDHVDPQHRMLCSICMDHLYVQHKQLKSKWKIKQSLCYGDSTNDTEVRFYTKIPTEFHKSNEPYLLKSKVALWLGYADWTAFLKRNRALTRKNKFANFHFAGSDRWLCARSWL